jgi:hypothetical protein
MFVHRTSMFLLLFLFLSVHHHEQAAPPNSKTDPYHGQEQLAKIAARFITHLFACPDYPPSSTHAQKQLAKITASFITHLFACQCPYYPPSSTHDQKHLAKIAARFIAHLFTCPDYPPLPTRAQEQMTKIAARFITHLFTCPDYPPSSTHAQEQLAKITACFITHLFTCPDYPPSSTHAQEQLAKIAARFITHLFTCPDYPPSSTHAQEQLAKITARFITHLFTCPDYPPSSTHAQEQLAKIAARFITHLFTCPDYHQTKLHPSMMFASLILLQRLKARFPLARGSSGHRLFISAFMISSKVMCDDTYSNKSWSVVAQGMFNLREINQMEREMCNYLEWELTTANPMLFTFETVVKRDFREQKPMYPSYPTSFVSKRAAGAETSTSNSPFQEQSSTSSPVPGFTQNGCQTRNANQRLLEPRYSHARHDPYSPTRQYYSVSSECQSDGSRRHGHNSPSGTQVPRDISVSTGRPPTSAPRHESAPFLSAMIVTVTLNLMISY